MSLGLHRFGNWATRLARSDAESKTQLAVRASHLDQATLRRQFGNLVSVRTQMSAGSAGSDDSLRSKLHDLEVSRAVSASRFETIAQQLLGVEMFAIFLLLGFIVWLACCRRRSSPQSPITSSAEVSEQLKALW